MGRKPRVDRSPEEKWQIVQEGIKSGNVSETCRRQLRQKHREGIRRFEVLRDGNCQGTCVSVT
jgi:transposase-like protein